MDCGTVEKRVSDPPPFFWSWPNEPTTCSSTNNLPTVNMAFSRNFCPLGRCLFAAAMLVGLRAVSAQTFRFPEDATPTEFQGFVTSAPGSGE
jgi:hypothetical protein